MSSTTKQIFFPFINPNEPEMILAALLVKNGQFVSPGDMLCTLETTKATQELISDQEGYIFGITAQAGEMVKAGEFFCILSPNPNYRLETQPPIETNLSEFPSKLRITQPALKFAQERGIDFQSLPKNELITIEKLKSLQANNVVEEFAIPDSWIDPEAIIIYGGGGHGKSLIELIRAAGHIQIAGIIDDGKSIGSSILNIPVIGHKDHLQMLYQKGFRLAVNAVGGISNLADRVSVFESLQSVGFSCPTVIHPTAWIEQSAMIGDGSQIFPHAYVGSDSKLGYGVIINTGTIVSHDCGLGDYVNLSPGAILAGEVKIGSSTLIGMGVTINLQVRVGEHCRIGNGATIKRDVPPNTIIHAGAIWPS